MAENDFDPYAFEGELADTGYYDIDEADQADYFTDLDDIYGYTDPDISDYNTYTGTEAGGYAQASGEEDNWLSNGLKGINWNKWAGLGAGLLSQYMSSKQDKYSKPKGGGGRGGGGGGGGPVSYAVAADTAKVGEVTGKPRPVSKPPSLMK